jgi:NitT/TauT family transport system permease protein
MPPASSRVWQPVLGRLRFLRHGWIDLLLILGVGGVLFGLVDLLGQATAAHRPKVEIDLSPWALPRYTFYSFTRGMVAYLLSLAFTLIYGYWAAKDRAAERILIPLLDVLQSIPVLSFLPAFVILLVSLFPGSNIGLELAAVLNIFTGQVWNMVFSFYHSLRSIPTDKLEVAAVFRFSAWQKAKWIELPSAAIGLIWNSMMSMAGGWVFLSIIETFRLGEEDYRLPGIGSYLREAQETENVGAMTWGVLALVLMIVALDQLLWRPVVVWAQKFRVEDDACGPSAESWVLNWLRRSRLIRAGRMFWHHWAAGRAAPELVPPSAPVPVPSDRESPRAPAWGRNASIAGLVLLLAVLAYGMVALAQLLWTVPGYDWGRIAVAAAWTFGRVTLATALGTLWVVPVGLAIGLSPRLATWLQPVVQVVASFPAPILFPILLIGMTAIGMSLDFGAMFLMLLGTQWYILFNVVSGAMAIPADMREAARAYRLPLWQRLRHLYLPAIFPFLVTGWVTAAGGAWNLSIAAEYFTMKDKSVLEATGLGALISQASEAKDFPLLAASTLVLASIVVLINRTVWRALYRLAETRYTLTK